MIMAARVTGVQSVSGGTLTTISMDWTPSGSAVAFYTLPAGSTFVSISATRTSGESSIFTDQTAPVGPFGGLFTMGITGNSNTLNGGLVSNISLTLPSAVNQWRFVAASYSGGASGSLSLYSLSDNLSTGPTAQTGISNATAQQLHLGPSPYISSTATAAEIDLSAYLVSSPALSLSALQAIYPSMKSILARRGITVL
jgi:hypothetical protein